MQQTEVNWEKKLELVNSLKEIYAIAITGGAINKEVFNNLKNSILQDDVLTPLLPKKILQFENIQSFVNFSDTEFKSVGEAKRFIDSEFFKLSSFLKKQANNNPKLRGDKKKKYWWLNVDSKTWELKNLNSVESYSSYKITGTERRVTELVNEVKSGDLVIVYIINSEQYAVAILEIIKPLKTEQDIIYFTNKYFLERPITYKEMLQYPELVKSEWLKSPGGSLFELSESAFNRIIELSNYTLDEQEQTTKSPFKKKLTPRKAAKLSRSKFQDEEAELDDLGTPPDDWEKVYPELSDELPGAKQETVRRKILAGRYAQFSISDNINPVLGVNELSEEIAKLLENLQNRDKGRMVGIFGKWGRGKTFLMNQVWKTLEARKENKFYRVDFHAWKFQDTHASWAYLYEAFAKRYYKSYELKGFKKWRVQNSRLLKLNINRFGLFPIISFLIGVLFFIFTYITDSDPLGIKTFINSLFGKSILGLTALYTIKYLYSIYGKFNTKAKALFQKYFDKVSFKQLLGIQAEIQNELKSLLKVWIKDNENKKVLLIVDDIDRCSEERLIQIIDSLRVMLEDDDISQRVVVLAAVDERVLRGAIKYKYYDLLEKDYAMKNNDESKVIRVNQLTREYMDKLFLSGIKLGILTSEERQEIFKEFSKDKVEKVQQNELEDNTNNNNFVNEQSKTENYNNGFKETLNNENITEEDINQIPTEQDDEEPVEIEITETDFEISANEYKELNNLLENFYDATPRQIRIFYYRYLLARNLLSMNMKKSGSKLTEGPEEQNSIMGELLLKFSEMDNAPDVIRAAKNDIISSKENDYTIKLADLEITHKKNIFLEIMNVLEMVVAY